MQHPEESNVKQWVAAEALREALVAAAEELAPQGIDLLVVKGVYYAFALGEDPGRRAMQDADAIVVGGSFDQAVAHLLRSPAWRLTSDDWSTKGFTHRRTGGLLDIHRLALPPCFGNVRLSSLRARASRLPDRLGCLLVPDPLDAAGITVANFVKDCAAPVTLPKLVADLDLLRRVASVTPGCLAERLREHELRRIGIVTFAALEMDDARWGEWLDALRPSPLERQAAVILLSNLARHTLAHASLSFLVVRSLADTPTRAVAGFTLTAVRLMRDQIRPLLGRRRRRWLRGGL